MTKEQLRVLLTEAYTPVIETIVERSLEFYDLLYVKLKDMPEAQRDKIVNDAIDATAGQLKVSFGAMKVEDIMKNMKEDV